MRKGQFSTLYAFTHKIRNFILFYKVRNACNLNASESEKAVTCVQELVQVYSRSHDPVMSL